MRNAIRVSAMLLALVGSAHAGEVLTPPATQPPPPAPAVQGPTTDCQIDTGATAPTADGIIQNEAAATFAQVILNLLALS
jgi:hypothetical protein